MIIDSTLIPGRMGVSAIKAFCYLYEEETANLTELAGVAGITTAAMTGLMDRYEAEELLQRERSPDRRSIIARLTTQGRELVASMRPVTGGKEVAA